MNLIISLIVATMAPWTFVEMPSSKSTTIHENDLYEIILEQDRIFFEAYNRCDMETQGQYLDENLEFYHDQGGPCTDKAEVLAKTQKNICGKVSRSLVSGSVQVSPIPGYGAVELGQHQFKNKQEPEGTPSKASTFVILWKQYGDSWKMTRIISLH